MHFYFVFFLQDGASKTCGWQMQGHFDGSFNFYDTDFAIIGLGMNSMGAHFNPVFISIVNLESSEVYIMLLLLQPKIFCIRRSISSRNVPFNVALWAVGYVKL